MRTINERLSALIRELHMNTSSFARSIGKPNTTVKNITDGRSKPGFDILEAILETYPDINPAWLMKGVGEIYQGTANVTADGGGAALEEELRERIKLQNETIADLRYTVELQKQILVNQGLGKTKGVTFDRFPNILNPNLFLGRVG